MPQSGIDAVRRRIGADAEFEILKPYSKNRIVYRIEFRRRANSRSGEAYWRTANSSPQKPQKSLSQNRRQTAVSVIFKSASSSCSKK